MGVKISEAIPAMNATNREGFSPSSGASKDPARTQQGTQEDTQAAGQEAGQQGT